METLPWILPSDVPPVHLFRKCRLLWMFVLSVVVCSPLVIRDVNRDARSHFHPFPGCAGHRWGVSGMRGDAEVVED